MKTLTIILLFHICLLPKMLCAQEINDSMQIFWIRPGLGGANNAISANISLNYQQENILYGFQATYAFHARTNNHESATEFCPLIGYAGTGEYIRFSASAGISLVYTTYYSAIRTPDFQLFTQYEADKTRADFGIPIIAQVRFPLSNRSVLSFSGQHTFSTKSFSAFTFGIDIKLSNIIL